MQRNATLITLQEIQLAAKSAYLALFLVIFSSTLFGQTTIATNFTYNNGSTAVTFNFQNSNAVPVRVTDIATVINLLSGNADAAVYVKNNAINGLPGTITPSNGWNLLGTNNSIASNGIGLPQTVLSNLSIDIPAGSTVGFCVSLVVSGATTGALGYGTIPVGTFPFTAGGCSLICGTNISYGGAGDPLAPANTPRGFIGSVTFIPLSPCAGTPAPGNTISSAATACPFVPFKLSPQNATAGSGVTYQWQSAGSIAGPFADIASANNSSLTTSQTASTYYRVNVTCGGATTSTTPVQVLLTPNGSCYCQAGGISSTDEKISSVKFAQINRASTATTAYESFLGDTATLQKLNNDSITISILNGFATDQVLVWIDLNQDGDFSDAGELLYTSQTGVGPHSGIITIPATANLGVTRMRVRMHDTSSGAKTTPCGNSDYGQVEDYTIRIVPCIPVSITGQPADAAVQCGSSASFKLSATGTGISYTWQQRSSIASPWINLTNTSVFSGVNSNTLTITGAPATLSASQYRVIYSGGCSGTDFSSIATLTVNPLVASISPVTPIIQCLGSSAAQAISITNASGVSAATFSSTAAVNIPDNSPTGILSPITVSGIPAGAIISEVKITLNISHPYVGDLDINIKAPNNGNLNLAGGLDNGTGSNATANFTNTVFSSLGTAAISGAAAPRTGVYKADALAFYGPSGNIQTVTSFSGLTSALNGVWNLAVADFGAGDAGTINSWSISFSYGVPATGIFTPVNGLFTNAATTIPYTGGPISTVYALPVATTTYSVVVTTPTCVSAPLSIPVTVNVPISGSSTVANKAVCAGSNTFFTSTAPTAGSGIQHQFQVSKDGGVTFANISNTGVYAGATTSTLTITGATATMNNYQYRDSLYVTSCNSKIFSSIGKLTVNPLPTVITNASPATALRPGMTTSLTATVSPNAGASYTWFRDGIVVPGAVTNVLAGISVDALGDYTVAVNDVNGCGGKSAIFTVRDSVSNDLFIYPNANTGKFNVRLYSNPTYSFNSRILTIFDSKGARIYSKSYPILAAYSNMPVDISNFGPGIYTIDVTDNKGNRLKTGRVVVF